MMCNYSALELQTMELEYLFSTFGAANPYVSLEFNGKTRKGSICVYSKLAEGQKVLLRGPNVNIVLRNTVKLIDEGDYILEYLPPLVLDFTFKNNYPGTGSKPIPLNFSLQSVWLPQSMLRHLVDELMMIGNENPGELILWQFIDFLQDRAIYEVLDSTEKTTSFLNLDLYKFYACNGASLELSLKQCMEILLLNNEDHLDFEFDIKLLDCPVCCETKLGSMFFRFPKCRHDICLRCVRQYFTGMLSDGLLLQKLACLQCGEEVGPAEVRAVLSSKDYATYEELQLKRGLSLMPDIANCPRPGCNAYVILDNPHLGRCPACELAFCPHCLRTYHGTINRCAMWEGPEPEVVDIEAERLRARVKKEEEASRDYLNKNCKNCPNCRASCEKVSGCNKMTCQFCHKHFCWICGELILDQINPYSHFSSGSCANLLWNNTEPGIDIPPIIW
ncbi:unnamed protein product [Calicophoron daubneyi]|uniref:RBR-type E3 ubiquitin transferase n=1 Tax=Calicophoron daubneyi TaxID=300641 RepID=A0AAV2TCI1_CALDB